MAQQHGWVNTSRTTPTGSCSARIGPLVIFSGPSSDRGSPGQGRWVRPCSHRRPRASVGLVTHAGRPSERHPLRVGRRARVRVATGPARRRPDGDRSSHRVLAGLCSGRHPDPPERRPRRDRARCRRREGLLRDRCALVRDECRTRLSQRLVRRRRAVLHTPRNGGWHEHDRVGGGGARRGGANPARPRCAAV